MYFNALIDRVFSRSPVKETEIKDLRVIIFSDQHRGSGDKADDFRFSKESYENALDHYKTEGFELILLGDVEELWENNLEDVNRVYQSTLVKEAAFGDRLIKIWGNHDADWRKQTLVNRYIKNSNPHALVAESLNLHVNDGADRLGSIFMLHGHQGSVWSDRWAPFSKFMVRYVWRLVQIILNKPLTLPSTDTNMRSKHDEKFYEWSKNKSGTILITGHTHEPVFTSFTYADQLILKTRQLEERQNELNTDELKELADCKRRIAKLESKDSTHLNPDGQSTPCYFNTGCCSFSDGEITGIEIESGSINLIKWTTGGERKVIQQQDLRSVFESLAD